MYINKSKLSPGSPETVVMGNPTFCCAGLFITWWGYLAMNSASTLGVEGTRWGRLHRIIRLPLCHSLDKLQASIMHLTSLDLNTGLWLLWRSHVTWILASDCPREVIIWTEYWPLILSGGSSLPRGLYSPWPAHLVVALQASFSTTSSTVATSSMLAKWSPQSWGHWLVF